MRVPHFCCRGDGFELSGCEKPMSAFHSTAALETETGDEWYGRMSRWVCIYFCLPLTVLFLKGAGVSFVFLLSGLWLGCFGFFLLSGYVFYCWAMVFY